MKNFMHRLFSFGYVASGALCGMMLYEAFVDNDVKEAVWAMVLIFANMLANEKHSEKK